MNDEEASALLLSNLDGRPLAEPRPIRFKTGMRQLGWNKNVVSIGLSSGFLEPLESTSIHLIQAALQLLIDFFPDKELRKADIDEYNRQNRFNFERIRDFIILHYHLNQRTDSDFWINCAMMSIPATLKEKIDLYRSSGRVVRFNGELFSEVGWLQVMEGQNLSTDAYHPLADLIDEDETARYLEGVRSTILECVKIMPTHEAFIAEHCAAGQAS
jgi:tryptophan halogenase